jgi:RNA polymerase primary sigma factor
LAERVGHLLRHEVEYIPNADFARGTSRRDEAMLEVAAACTRRDVQPRPRDLPVHLARLCQTALLSAAEERQLFEAMNYLKYRVNVLRAKLRSESPDRRLVEKAQRLLDAATIIRDHIVQANMRLVISIVKKFVTPQYSFDELLSDGIDTLIQAVDKFDFDRGFRFSTYAYRSIARNAYRRVSDLQKEQSRFVSGSDELIREIPEEAPSQMFREDSWRQLTRTLKKMLANLDRREQLIVQGRYSAGADNRAKTFQSMADALGVSKERVRQIEQRAVRKLKAMARDLGVPDPFEPNSARRASDLGRDEVS